MWAAYVLSRRVHRDISLSNIVLVKKGKRWRTGILIDWELSSVVGEDGKVNDTARVVSTRSLFYFILIFRKAAISHSYSLTGNLGVHVHCIATWKGLQAQASG